MSSKCYVVTLGLSNGPPRCGWQDLKDYVRDKGNIRPGRIELGRPLSDGFRIGSVLTQTYEEANRTYDFFLNNGYYGNVVRLAIVAKPSPESEETSAPIRGPDDSRARRGHTSMTSLNLAGSLSGHNVQHRRPMYPTATQLPMPRPMYYESLYPSPPPVTQVQSAGGSHRPNPRRLPHIDSSSQWTPRNVSFERPPVTNLPATSAVTNSQSSNQAMSSSLYGTALTSHRRNDDSSKYRMAVRISNLPGDIQARDLEPRLQQFGNVRVRVYPGKNNRSTAVAMYARYEEAANAVQGLNGIRIRGTRLECRVERQDVVNNTTAHVSNARKFEPSRVKTQLNILNERRPLVVNGARGSVRRSTVRDSDPDSSSSDEDAAVPRRSQKGTHRIVPVATDDDENSDHEARVRQGHEKPTRPHL